MKGVAPKNETRTDGTGDPREVTVTVIASLIILLVFIVVALLT